MVTPRYLSSADAAVYLGFGSGRKGAAAIRQLKHRDRGFRDICKKVGNRIRIDIRDMDAWMKTQKGRRGES